VEEKDKEDDEEESESCKEENVGSLVNGWNWRTSF
jgi:hypothetical protein